MWRWFESYCIWAFLLQSQRRHSQKVFDGLRHVQEFTKFGQGPSITLHGDSLPSCRIRPLGRCKKVNTNTKSINMYILFWGYFTLDFLKIGFLTGSPPNTPKRAGMTSSLRSIFSSATVRCISSFPATTSSTASISSSPTPPSPTPQSAKSKKIFTISYSRQKTTV